MNNPLSDIKRIDVAKFILDGCKKILQQRAKSGNDIHLSRFERWFYTLKALVCWIIDRHPDGISTTRLVDEYIVVAWLEGGTYQSHGEPTVHWAVGVYVGYGVFSNWYAFDCGISD
jgi:hypothetical protein